MGIELEVDGTRIEFKKELTLKTHNPLNTQNECVPKKLERGEFYEFNLKGYFVFPLGKPILLFEEGNQRQVVSIEITEQTNFLLGGINHTRGEYYVRNCQEQ